MGLSAWKQYRTARWPLRVNPSSGNLHPTEAYVIRARGVYHYAPREHALEERCVFGQPAATLTHGGRDGFLVALTSIHWRESWKYGERAFRYCQHDTGHAIAALRFAAALLGWTLRLLPAWPDEDLASLLGLDRDSDFGEAEREEPECIAVVTPGGTEAWEPADYSAWVDAARRGTWSGIANQLSPSRVEWPIIDEVAKATRRVRAVALEGAAPAPQVHKVQTVWGGFREADLPDARQIILQRRSALGFDAQSTLPRERFLAMLGRVQPVAPPWDAIDWPPHIHLLVFVHRIEGMTPGLYAYLRDPAVAAQWRHAMRPEFLWEAVDGPNAALFLLVPTDVTWVANRVSCDQDIAADGFFSLGMVARLESTLRERGDWFYRRLFWESGIIGQVLYLEAEAAGARATGIGCFYDDPVHDMAGLAGHEWQSIYHLATGTPVEDTRLTTEPGYPWEAASR